MTDELKFFDPEAGAELHRVPEGATIPAREAYGFIRRNGARGWVDRGAALAFDQLKDVTYFTREPIAPPKPPLPTEPGLYRDKDGDLWHVNDSGGRALLMEGGRAFEGSYYPWGESENNYAPFVPVTLVPTETWDRLRVLDPEDKRDRIDRYGRFVRHSERVGELWAWELARASRNFGPLRFADEVSDR